MGWLVVTVAVLAMVAVGLGGAVLMTTDVPRHRAPELVSAPQPRGHGLAAQLQRREDVLWQLMYRHSALGTVLCGVEVLGRSHGGRKVYAWLECGDYSTGRGATELGSGADAAVIRYAGHGHERHIVRVRVPSPESRQADIARMFPPAVRDEVNRGWFDVAPDERQRLKVARRL